MAWPCENQAPVLDAGDAEDAARLENSFALDEAVERVVERFEDRVAETGVEVIVRKVEPVDAADPELDILDLVLGGVVPCVCERLLCRIDSVDVCDRLRQTQCDGPLPAADIKKTEVVVQVRQQEVGVVCCVPDFERRLECRTHPPAFEAGVCSTT